MRRILILCQIVTICTYASAATQRDNEQPKMRVVAEPPEVIFPVLAYQPECPLEFVNVSLLHNLEGGGIQLFQLRNRGTKPVRAYRIAALTSAGAGSEWGDGKTPLREMLMPGEVRPRQAERKDVVIVPLTEELRERHRLKGGTQGLVVFMVVRVVFADGSVFDAEAQYQSLRAFFEKIESTRE